MVSADRARSRTFVVTGAASGIGLATAQRLLAEGGSVVGADLAAPPDLGPDFRFVTADVTDEAAIAAVLAAVPDRLDGVVHAAGDRKSTRLNSSHITRSRMPSSA